MSISFFQTLKSTLDHNFGNRPIKRMISQVFMKKNMGVIFCFVLSPLSPFFRSHCKIKISLISCWLTCKSPNKNQILPISSYLKSKESEEIVLYRWPEAELHIFSLHNNGTSFLKVDTARVGQQTKQLNIFIYWCFKGGRLWISFNLRSLKKQ